MYINLEHKKIINSINVPSSYRVKGQARGTARGRD